MFMKQNYHAQEANAIRILLDIYKAKAGIIISEMPYSVPQSSTAPEASHRYCECES